MRTARRSLALFVALLTTAGCTPETEGDPADAGPRPPDGGAPPTELGALAGEWELTFDDGAHRAAHAWIGDADGLGVTVRATLADDGDLHDNVDAQGRRYACRAAEDELRLRLAAATAHGIAIRRYDCGLLGPDERRRDAVDWPAERFDTPIERGHGAVVAWRTADADGPFGLFGGAWTLESNGVACTVELAATGAFSGNCIQSARFGRDGTDFSGTIDAPLISGDTDDDWAFAGRRVAAVERDPSPLPQDPLGGAGGRWQVWGNPGLYDLAAGATLDLAAQGTTVTARMTWREYTFSRRCGEFEGGPSTIDHTIEFDARVEGDGPTGDALWSAVQGCLDDSDEGSLFMRPLTATRVAAAPAALPLLGGEWLLRDDEDPDFGATITLRDDRLTVEDDSARGVVFEGPLGPRAIVVLQQADGRGRKGDDWVGGRRIGDD